ncbi:putative leucine-rich repeat receptor-like serine/threonine-protein kinase [Exaiptasia diaphana]|nr:putative leucine-rich repeat receptor-like serine/threonine-protein kinase [Exaiptasia diaphana]
MKANYKLDTEIGAGSYGKVYKATLNKKPVAVKLLHESLFHESIIDKFREECELLQRLNHKNVVRLIQFDISCSSRPALITELMDCDLEKYIKVQTKKIPFPEVVSIMLDVAEGLRYLHYECNPAIIHRDLASKNILLTKKRQAKIADLGLAKFFLRSERMFASPVPGTQFYAAPETFPTYPTFSSNNVEYNEKIDIFSFGIVLMETIIGNRSNLESIFDTKIRSHISGYTQDFAAKTFNSAYK